MPRTLVSLALILAAVGCNKKAADTSSGDAGGPNGGTPAEDRIQAFDKKVNPLGLYSGPSLDLLAKDVEVYTLAGGGSESALAKIPDPGFPFGLAFGAVELTPEGFAKFKPTPNLRYLNVSQQQQLGDRGLALIAKFTGLTELDVGTTGVNDAGLAHLKGLTKLRRLVISGNGITNDGLPHLAGLQNLTHLELGPAALTDEGMKHLAGLRNLTHLRLTGNPITDDGLKQLAALKKLTELHLDATKVTDAGTDRLKIALPGCNVIR